VSAVVGVLGGHGDVGKAAVRMLLEAGFAAVRIGGRHPRWTGEPADGEVSLWRADYADPESLHSFAVGCDAVLNCAGPSFRIAERVAAAAARAGAHYVDAGGDDPLHAALDASRYAVTGQCAVLSAGLQPGLTGLYPRWVAAQVPGLRRLALYVAVLDEFTETAAADFVYGTAAGLTRPSMTWRNGAPRRASGPGPGPVRLPFLPQEPAAVLAGLSTESERTAAAIGLEHGDFCTVLTGDQVAGVFSRIRALPADEAVAALCLASRLDLAGRSPLVLLLAEAVGETAKTMALRAGRAADLAGAVAALATRAVADGGVPAGVHYAADVLDPGPTLAALADAKLAETLVLDARLADLADTEEGAL
jgi:hypothetical protein